MDLKKLEYLLHVAEYGSFTKAAAVIGIAQPALGRQVQKLEAECGVRLLYRHGRGVALTPEGETLLERVRPLVHQLQHAALDLHEESAAASGPITLGLTPTAGSLFGLALLKTLRLRFPKLRVNIVEAYSGYVHEWLTNGRVDLAILHDARRSQHILVEPLGAARLSLVSPPGTKPLVQAPSAAVALKKLAGVPLVLPTRNHGLRRALDYAASRAGVHLDVQYEIDTISLALDVVRDGLAHTVLPYTAVEALERRGELISRRLGAPEVEIRLMMGRAANRPPSRAIQFVEAEIRNQVKLAAKRFPLYLTVAAEEAPKPARAAKRPKAGQTFRA
ncbi:LysR family transcriptional regulator [Ramlibacter sp.]|uniref:LysR family transcriptional regulator n=1 Tax=Ramlibacter sp. TaxID=1917967 RepID=UPI003D10C5F7